MASFKDLQFDKEVEKKIAVAAANPVGAELLDLIARAGSAAELHRITEQITAGLEEMSEEERRGLEEAVNLQFCVLNAAALKGTKPRWDT